MSPQHLVLLLLASSWACAGKLEHQIIGGHEARPHSRPYMAYLKTGRSSCGGFLVAPDWVLTAGHCNGNITVILGAHDVHVPEDTQLILAVEAYYLHPECMVDAFAYNDVLLLKLARPAILNPYVQPIALTESSDDLPTGTPCSVAGWGLIDPEQSTNKLFETDINIFSRRKCAILYPVLDDGMICAGDPMQLRSPAQEDSGGPLVCNGKAEGIMSFGMDFPPSVFARIGFYLPWIKQIMG